MDILRKFASLGHGEKYSYAFDGDSYTYSSGFKIEEKFRMYESLGHGLIQHSSDWPVTAEYLTDYLYSLAVEMLKESEDRPDFIRAVGYQIGDNPRKELIEFAASVVYKEKTDEWSSSKRRYYSTSEMKITSNQDKRHDKRYQEVSKSEDGTPEAVYRMILPEYSDGLRMFCYARAIREWFHSDDNKAKNRHHMEQAGAFLKWFTDDRQGDRWHKSRELECAFDTVKAIVDSWQSKIQAENGIENYQRDLERQRKRVEEETTTEVA